MRALILGVLGQDGSYLAEQLLAEGHEVHGAVRRSNVTSPTKLVWVDLLDQDSLERALLQIEPDVVFNLAAITSPGGTWGTGQPPLLADVTGVGVVHLLDAMVDCAPEAKLVHASSSAIYDPHRYGLYGVAKLFAHECVVGYRGELHASNAVLFSHTSPRQDPRFLARRICSTLRRIADGSGEKLVLGDVESRRDWGSAHDYARALAAVAEAPAGDYQICTGATHSVRDLVEVALAAVGLSWDVVHIDPDAPRVPDEVNPGTHPVVPGWKPDTAFEDMVRELAHA